MYRALQKHPDFEQADFSSVRSWGSGGAPMSAATIHELADRGIRIQQSFGMTETGPTVCLMDRDNAVTKSGSVGKPQLFVEAKIVDVDGNVVGPGEMGELLIRGPAVTPGYWNQEAATHQAIDDGNWFRSGDIATYDDDGYYTIVDRQKDMYISGSSL